jgi:hypothetical protein
MCFTIVPPHASLLLFMLHCCSTPCFTALFLFVFYYYSLCFATPFISLLLIMFHYFLCFVVVPPHVSLLFLVFYCSSCFAVLTTSLLCGALLLLHALVLNCFPRYLFAPCCFVVPSCYAIVQSFIIPLPKLYPPPPPFLCNVENQSCLGGIFKTSKLLVSFFCFLCFFLKKNSGFPSLIYFYAFFFHYFT